MTLELYVDLLTLTVSPSSARSELISNSDAHETPHATQVLQLLRGHMTTLGVPLGASLVWTIACSDSAANVSDLTTFANYGHAIAPEKVLIPKICVPQHSASFKGINLSLSCKYQRVWRASSVVPSAFKRVR